jgi:hypothetical protein
VVMRKCGDVKMGKCAYGSWENGGMGEWENVSCPEIGYPNRQLPITNH